MSTLSRFFFNKIANNRLDDSIANKLRRKRFGLLLAQMSRYSKPIRILDVGGTQIFWESMGFAENSDFHIVILNIEKIKSNFPNISSVIADGLKIPFEKIFDIAFSNSVIEHMGNFENQKLLANEIKRVSKSFFVQTPYKYFPIEPHAVFPFLQFFPLKIKKIVIKKLRPGWYREFPIELNIDKEITSIRLLSKKELKALFSP